MQNFYEILGVKVDATDKEIRASYIEKIKKYHPDTYNGDKSFAEQQTALITEAYTTLKDETLRRRYNLRNNISTNSSYQKQAPKTQPKTQKNTAPKPSPQQKQEKNRQNTVHEQKTEEKPAKTNENDEKMPQYTAKQLIEDAFIVILAVLLMFMLAVAIF